ncbi:retrotransposon protein, putative, ty1-copia subclass [Tanacetum coccineum]|uniref:Retrotransposon protein, putative, ty1-copia subclass n=1 Tax=Tanacetum coccineum TaxID=301880 RepID=A0ABQ5AHH3_9ASTR
MERGFLSQKGSGVGRGVKEKQSSMADKEKNGVAPSAKEMNKANKDGVAPFVTVTSGKILVHKRQIRLSASYANLFTTGPIRKAMNFRTLFTPWGNGVDVVVLVESIRATSARFANTVYGFFLGRRVAYLVVANYVRNTWGKYGLVKSMLNSSTGIFSFQFSSMDGLDTMLENGPWFIRNNLLILKKWDTDVNLLKEDVGNVPVWVKLHGVPVTAFSEDGLSAISTKLGTPLMIDSYTSDMCIQLWGRSSFARAMIEVRADVELKDTIVEECPKNLGLGEAKNLKKPSWATRGVPVGLKVGFIQVKEYRPVSKKPTANTSNNKKKGVEPTKEVSNLNPFDVLNSVDNDGELGTNGGTSNLASNRADSSGSSFWNVETSYTSTTPIVDKIVKLKKLIIDGKVTLMDDDGKPLKSLLEQWTDSYENGDYDEDLYDDDMYEGQDIPDKIQDICDNLDIKVRGHRKK